LEAPEDRRRPPPHSAWTGAARPGSASKS